MATSNNDVKYLMDKLEKFGQGLFADGANKTEDVVYLKQKNGGKGNQSIYFEAVPPFMYQLFEEHTRLMVEYTDSRVKEAKEDAREESKRDIKERDEQIAALKSELRVHRNDQDALACYNRRENLKIQGVEFTEDENTNEIVKEICKLAGREITDADISTSHRNGSTKKNNNTVPGMATASNKVPDIYVRFTRRDVKTEVFEKRKNLATNQHCPTKYKNVAIYEDVTPLRSRIMYELRNRDNKQAFKYVWSRGGRIFCRTQAEANMTTNMPKPTVINKPEDLLKIGFTESEVEAIILNKRE